MAWRETVPAYEYELARGEAGSLLDWLRCEVGVRWKEREREREREFCRQGVSRVDRKHQETMHSFSRWVQENHFAPTVQCLPLLSQPGMLLTPPHAGVIGL